MKYGHYVKDVAHLEVLDVYRVLVLFGVSDPCIQHAVKKLLVAGGRGAKDARCDIQEAIDSLERWQQMRAEDAQQDAQHTGIVRQPAGQPFGITGLTAARI